MTPGCSVAASFLAVTNFRAPEVVVYLCTYLCVHSALICWSSMNKQSVAATKLVLTAVILNDSGPITMVGHLKCIGRRCIKSFGGRKGG